MITIALGIFLGWVTIMVVSTGLALTHEICVQAGQIAARGRAIRESKVQYDRNRIAAYMAENERNHAKR